MTFIVQTQINIAFNDRQSEFDGFEPLTVGLTLRVDLNFRNQMFHQLFAFKGIHHIVEFFKADENFVNVVARDFIRFDCLLLCTGIHQIVFGFLDFIVHPVKPLVKVRFADDVVAVIRVKCVNLLHDFGLDGVILPQLLFSGCNFLFNAVVEVIIKLVSNPKFAAMMQEKINSKVDTTAIEQEIAAAEKQLRQYYSVKSKIMEEI